MAYRYLPAWIGRFLIGVVLLFNIQCALAFLIAPEFYAPNFELSGAAGSGVVRGFGILFLMWNVPYAAATIDPNRRFFSLYEAIAMQAIGFIGESVILAILPHGHSQIQATLERFILFDGFGMVALLAAAWVTRSVKQM